MCVINVTGVKHENMDANNTEKRRYTTANMHHVVGIERMDSRIRGWKKWIQTLSNQIGI